MNKILKVAGIVFVCFIGIVLIAGVIFLKTADFKQLTIKLTDFISEKVDKDVTIESFGIAFRANYGITLDINQLNVENNAVSASTSLVGAERVSLGLDILKLITGKIVITKAEVQNPIINIRTSELVNLKNESESIKDVHEDLTVKMSQPQENVSKKESKKSSLGSFLMRSIRVVGGEVNYIDDLNEKQSILIPIKDLMIDVSEFEFDQFFNFSVNARLWNEVENIKIKGKGNINEKNFSVQLKDVNFETDLHQWKIDEIVNNGISLPIDSSGAIRGKFSVDINQAFLGSDEKPLAFVSSGNLLDAKFKVTGVPLEFSNFDVRFDLNESDLNLKELFFYVADGKVQAKAEIKNYLLNPLGDISFTVQEVNVGEIVKSLSVPVDFQGLLVAEGKMNIKGNPAVDSQAELTGEMQWQILEGVLKGFNVLQMALSKISFIPELQQKLKSRLSEKYQQKLQQKDTPFVKFVVYLKPTGQRFVLDRTVIATDEFSLLITGYIDLNQNAALSGSLLINQEFSQELLNSVSDFSYFLNADGQIVIPFKPYQGKISNVMLLPDVEKIGKIYVQEKGKQELRNVIFKALDVDEQPKESSNVGTEGGQGGQGGQKVSPESILINDILNKIPLFN